jgi:hypothetical protein
MANRTTAQWTWTVVRIVLTLAAGGAAGAVGYNQYNERVIETRVEAQVLTCEQELRRAAETCVAALAQQRCPQPVPCQPAPDCIHNDVPCPPNYCCHEHEYGCLCKDPYESDPCPDDCESGLTMHDGDDCVCLEFADPGGIIYHNSSQWIPLNSIQPMTGKEE